MQRTNRYRRPDWTTPERKTACRLIGLPCPSEPPPPNPAFSLKLVSDYHPAFVEALKRHCPASDRLWHEATMAWYFRPAVLRRVVGIINPFFESAHLITANGTMHEDLHTGLVMRQMTIFDTPEAAE